MNQLIAGVSRLTNPGSVIQALNITTAHAKAVQWLALSWKNTKRSSNIAMGCDDVYALLTMIGHLYASPTVSC